MKSFKELLNEYYDLKFELKRINLILQEWIACNGAPKKSYYQMPSSNIKTSQPEIYLLKMEELSEKEAEISSKINEVRGQLEIYTYQLGREERIVIEARLFNKLRWWQIAQIVPCSIGQVRRYYNSGMEILESR